MRDPKAEQDFFDLMEYLVKEKNKNKMLAKIKLFEMKVMQSDDVFKNHIEGIKEAFLNDN